MNFDVAAGKQGCQIRTSGEMHSSRLHRCRIFSFFESGSYHRIRKRTPTWSVLFTILFTLLPLQNNLCRALFCTFTAVSALLVVDYRYVVIHVNCVQLRTAWYKGYSRYSRCRILPSHPCPYRGNYTVPDVLHHMELR